ncbi:hypothetical protein G6F56_008248 [Rhizopus delemar]|nr:hypothetical protein G6F56_008248 [Rhizopus delemar]
MGALFLAFCGYLINLIYHDRPLIQNSSEEITSYIDTPDIEFCIQNSTMQMIHCSAMYYNWTTVEVDNCWQRFFRPGANDGSVSRCYVFETNGTYRMTTGLTYDNRDALRRLDFYWKIDNLTNVTYASVSTPAIAVQLYDPRFSSWKAYTIGNSPMETLMYTNIKLGATRATTYMNHTSTISYSPQRYRAIRPRDALAIIGFSPNYIDINTLPNFEQTWPLLDNPPNPAVNRSLFHGLLSVQLAQSTIDIKTEVRQHTLLASLALAGGCYGVLTTLYILFFGMTRLTPWGLVHHVPVFISKRKHKKEKYEDEMFMQNQPAAASSAVSVPWFFNNKQNKISKTDTIAQRKDSLSTAALTKENSRMKSFDKSPIEESFFTDSIQLQQSSHNVFEPLFDDKSKSSPYPRSPLTTDPFTLSPLNNDTTVPKAAAAAAAAAAAEYPTDVVQNVHNMLLKEHARNNELSSRVEELEVILAEYFIDTSYVDQLRGRRKSFDGPQQGKHGNLP